MTADKTVKSNNLTPRPPVVAVVGHIDHGKSTLLDYIRQSNVVATEKGGITQHVSAYEVVHKSDDGKLRAITFLDTPGHEAFQAMRSRGANISDIAILVVSAEEGVKPQTLEALKSIKTAGVPFVVAINKIDRPNANPDRIKQELGENEIYVESYGGTVPSVNISAKTGEGVNDLLDLLLLVADLGELVGDKSAPATGFILESKLDPKVGPILTAIIKDGSLKTGDLMVVDQQLAKIKKMENFLGQNLTEASFSSPVRIFGFSEVPAAGQTFNTFTDKKSAENYLDQVNSNLATENCETDETDIHSEILCLPLVLKSDSHGTLEAVRHEITKIKDERVRFKIINTGVGTITDTDLKILIGSSQPLVAGFNVKIDRSAQDLADRHGVIIKTFDIIYKLAEWLTEEVANRRPKLTEEVVTAKIKILKIFNQVKDKQVLGGLVQQGVLKKGAQVKIWRREAEIGKGKVVELQAQKVACTEVLEGEQFGAMIESKNTIAEGDKLEAIEYVTK
ncbi:MAG: translation initiation factor IF-2 [Candidatus Vogelbacteria bacterium RIFOXYD1_FULL_44_32]|uniref:Translation initiation factor IF-2 n=1 Tax=Candidatus Vogelbacteria bacterium RIFOXYD1_FULL_44_32 TaxID=1802438 RepID=A0A1G2QDA6_9BACT|nr:MAG: translation initiation factor IF-2 [Candidatus Vogelbacteria bacterium RIFOXYD1_FULL_44_32]